MVQVQISLLPPVILIPVNMPMDSLAAKVNTLGKTVKYILVNSKMA